MKKFLTILISIAIIAAAAYYFIFFEASNEKESLSIIVKKGKFYSTVTATGELRAKNSIDIMGGTNARTINIWNMKIQDLIPEGTVVDSGDFVASLDKSEVVSKLKDIELNIQKIQTQFTEAQLDSTLNLSAARDELENLKYSLEEKKLLKEQSKYEAPSVIRQAEIDYEKIERSLKQSKKNYETKVKQAIAKLSQINTEMMKETQNLIRHQDILKDFTIYAPAPGMLIYARDWGGRKRIVGSQIDAWYPKVATLPDLTEMESVTYINEVDIQKIKKDQFVKISLDADPDKKLKGTVEKVANIGEESSKSNAKVFEVIVKVTDKDTTLLPSMTTSNEILIEELDNVLTLPLEAVHSYENDKDNKTEKYYYVFKKDDGKIIKKEVKTGSISENEVVITEGIKEGDEILLSIPENADELKTKRLAKK